MKAGMGSMAMMERMRMMAKVSRHKVTATPPEPMEVIEEPVDLIESARKLSVIARRAQKMLPLASRPRSNLELRLQNGSPALIFRSKPEETPPLL